MYYNTDTYVYELAGYYLVWCLYGYEYSCIYPLSAFNNIYFENPALFGLSFRS